MNEAIDSNALGLPPQAFLIPLRGFSGCHVVLVNDGQGSFVRKVARDAGYNARLMRQFEKQKTFAGNRFFQPVPVRGSGQLASGLAYIDMDYVPGITAAENLAHLPLSAIPHWARMLLHFTDVPEHGLIAPDIFHAKLASLADDLQGKNLRTPVVQKSLQKLGQRPWDNIPHSSCHGDLTLENILVHDGKLSLIDFLDSFADSWYLDIAKLLQDLLGGWSFRRKAIDRNLILRLASLRHTLETVLEERRPGSVVVIRDLYALNLLRILPYSSSDDERAFIENRLMSAWVFVP